MTLSPGCKLWYAKRTDVLPLVWLIVTIFDVPELMVFFTEINVTFLVVEAAGADTIVVVTAPVIAAVLVRRGVIAVLLLSI
jgi:hypothetical protein